MSPPDADARLRVAVIDDHPVVAAGLAQMVPGLDVVASWASVEEFLAAPQQAPDAVLLDLQLQSPLAGTAAIREILGAGHGPVVVYTSIAEEMLLAACLAAGALGAVVKTSPPSTVGEVVRMAVRGVLWVDPQIAGALNRYAEGRHAGVLSPQQANALRYRGQGLKQAAIAARIGVSDAEVVHRYLKAAVDKLVGCEDVLADGTHPGAVIDEMARRSGLATGLVRWQDLQRRRSSTGRGGR